MPSVVITDFEDLLAPAAVRLGEAGVECETMPPGVSALEVARRAHARVLLVGILPFDAAALAALDGTELIVRCGIGVDIIDVEAASELGISVANVPDYCADEVADHALTLLLTTMRRSTEFMRLWRVEGWGVTDLPSVRRIRGTTLGVIGLGRIGGRVVERARAFGLDVVAHDPHLTSEEIAVTGARPLELDELLETSDAITLHCPLTEDTRHLIDARALARVREGAVLVNTSRGGLVDLDALDAALEDGIVMGAGLDVLDGEPQPPLDHPILGRPNVVVTPHIAWYSDEARRELATKAADTAIAFLAGEQPGSVVNAEAVAAGRSGA